MKEIQEAIKYWVKHIKLFGHTPIVDNSLAALRTMEWLEKYRGPNVRKTALAKFQEFKK